MVYSWKVTWNSKYYNYNQLIKDYKNNLHNGIILQQYPKNKKNFAKIGDIVYISCDKRKIMKCSVISDLILVNKIPDKYNIGLHNYNHQKCCKIRIEKIYNNYIELKGNQQTWTKFKDQ